MSVIYSTPTHTVTLDAGGFVVRDATGQALEVFNARHKALWRADELSAHGPAERLFTPAPNVMAGQLGFRDA